jgi:Flp pilus assembly protein TadB
MAAPGHRRVQGTLFAFLTVFFAGIAWAAYDAGVWPIAVAGGVLTVWMGGLALRTFRAAREEMTR